MPAVGSARRDWPGGRRWATTYSVTSRLPMIRLRPGARSRPRTTRLTSPCARMVLTAGVPGLSVMAVGRHRSDGRERGGLGRVAGWNHAHYCLWHRANRERADGWPDGHGDERRHGRNLGGERNKVLP